MRIVIEAILPPGGAGFMAAKAEVLEAAIESAMKGPIKNTIQEAMKKRVKNWNHKPWFASNFSKNAAKNGGISILIYPTGENVNLWRWVSGGTPSHRIQATNAPLLRFQQFNTPKTQPGNRYGGAGRKYGPWVNTPAVQHPGIKARSFEEHIATEEETKIIALLSGIMAAILA
jgi:hypothetical protein